MIAQSTEQCLKGDLGFGPIRMRHVVHSHSIISVLRSILLKMERMASHTDISKSGKYRVCGSYAYDADGQDIYL